MCTVESITRRGKEAVRWSIQESSTKETEERRRSTFVHMGRQSLHHRATLRWHGTNIGRGKPCLCHGERHVYDIKADRKGKIRKPELVAT